MWPRIKLAEPGTVSIGHAGANIEIVIGRSIEAETEKGLEIQKLRPVENRMERGTCCKKEPT